MTMPVDARTLLKILLGLLGSALNSITSFLCLVTRLIGIRARRVAQTRSVRLLLTKNGTDRRVVQVQLVACNVELTCRDDPREEKDVKQINASNRMMLELAREIINNDGNECDRFKRVKPDSRGAASSW